MIRDTKAFVVGILMMVSFGIIYFYMMSPSFGNGRNGLEFADDMFNSISKGSAMAIVESEGKKASKWDGKSIDVNIKAKTEAEAVLWAGLYQKIDGTQVAVEKKSLQIKGDLGKIFSHIAADNMAVYNNNGDILKNKYNVEAREATYGWYTSTKEITKTLDKQEKFPESLALQGLQKKSIEPAYNYYGVVIEYATNNKGVMTFMLTFYLFYTLWYGFAIYYLCQGVGITMSKQSKKAEA